MTVGTESGEGRDTIRVELTTGRVSDIERDLRHLRRAEIAHTVSVFALLIVSAVLLATGLARLSTVAWIGGGLAFLAAFVVDGAIERRRDRELHTLLEQAARDS